MASFAPAFSLQDLASSEVALSSFSDDHPALLFEVLTQLNLLQNLASQSHFKARPVDYVLDLVILIELSSVAFVTSSSPH